MATCNSCFFYTPYQGDEQQGFCFMSKNPVKGGSAPMCKDYKLKG